MCFSIEHLRASEGKNVSLPYLWTRTHSHTYLLVRRNVFANRIGFYDRTLRTEKSPPVPSLCVATRILVVRNFRPNFCRWQSISAPTGPRSFPRFLPVPLHSNYIFRQEHGIYNIRLFFTFYSKSCRQVRYFYGALNYRCVRLHMKLKNRHFFKRSENRHRDRNGLQKTEAKQAIVVILIKPYRFWFQSSTLSRTRRDQLHVLRRFPMNTT